MKLGLACIRNHNQKDSDVRKEEAPLHVLAIVWYESFTMFFIPIEELSYGTMSCNSNGGLSRFFCLVLHGFPPGSPASSLCPKT